MKISIILPVYNSEKNLHISVDSVRQQSHEEWELIVVNDGSTDQTGQVCEKYAKEDSRIKVYHIQNQGPADARNYGLRKATGEYCIFLDSDDYLKKEALQVLQSAVRYQTFEIIFYGYSHDTYGGEKKIEATPHRLPTMVFKTNKKFQGIYDELADKGFTHPVWNKMFRLSFLRKYSIEFPSGLFISEDYIFNLKAYSVANAVLILDEVLHHYVSRDFGSITTSFRKDKIHHIEEVYKESSRLMKSWQPVKANKVANEFLGNISVYINSLYHKDCALNLTEKREIVQNIVRNERVIACVEKVQAEGNRNKIMAYLLKGQAVNTLLLTGRLAKLIQR